jgi:hypothetical protein
MIFEATREALEADGYTVQIFCPPDPRMEVCEALVADLIRGHDGPVSILTHSASGDFALKAVASLNPTEGDVRYIIGGDSSLDTEPLGNRIIYRLLRLMAGLPERWADGVYRWFVAQSAEDMGMTREADPSFFDRYFDEVAQASLKRWVGPAFASYHTYAQMQRRRGGYFEVLERIRSRGVELFWFLSTPDALRAAVKYRDYLKPIVIPNSRHMLMCQTFEAYIEAVRAILVREGERLVTPLEKIQPLGKTALTVLA